MKATLLLIMCALLLCVQSFAQQNTTRKISIKSFSLDDSIHIPFNADYYLIEDSCAQIIRQARFNKNRQFYGNFRDVSEADPKQVIAKGSYTNDGLKTGLFTLYYPNGTERATGHYEQNKPTGNWKLNYENGSPKLIFTAANGQLTIHEAWDENGNQIIAQGNGKYTTKAYTLTWNGKLLNGKPDGTWRATNQIAGTKEYVLTEKYKDGQFVNGNGPIGGYTDASRIIWLTPIDLPFLNAEKMAFSATPCGVAYKTGAHYKHGANAFSEEIKKQVSAYLKDVNLRPYDNELHIEAEIAEDGRIINFNYRNPFNDKIASGLVAALRRLPVLEPARADGKPTTQKFEIKFEFRSGVYRFNYRFMPL